MDTFRIWLNYLVEPSFRSVSHLIYRLNGDSCLRVGTLRFWGPRDFLEKCSSSLQRLRDLDSELYSRLTTRQKLEFYYNPTLLQAYYVWMFSIDDSYLAWQTDGIIARLVYSAQLAALFPRRAISKAKSRSLYSEVMATTRAWLEARSFPKELIDCFKEPPNTPLEPTPTAP
jgi:hypothetical protein